ncbi:MULTISPECIES: amino acid ABC transporter ATP-binding protein [Gordonia]|uniref:Cystine ABC transporter ATP-binding protein n=2 Tax=Gordonia TaxID=2053 RepID=L7LFC7_9ACTN|nr:MULTISPECIES: amino acid ABC transporter ATP-binding protein [Gordonia]AUH68903.1 amino acid ABC transporter ATP-binding protein [Gordonia sp. YC-JH1]KJR06975.1 glutamine ABC transporter ATP-binding protein [Gordonia sihwensis]MBY4570807.1 glutamine ABC transporter ATP-binding protein [Gordonia sihwensis]WFN91210.1 amino acid ABC transporter ATP-binding protein [Gordonia sihwensis]GAC59830.1 cystine ABC transporter ATP-binding protein [Gordonia sihwensis NBRC 108236]
MTALIQVDGLTKAFGDNEVLRGIEFSVDSGSVTAVIGPSGSGKTTLLRSLNALDVPDTGVIRVADVTIDFAGDYAKSDIARYRSQSGFVFQNHNLFPHKTVLENVIEGPVVVQRRPVADATADAQRLLDSVGLGDRADDYPAQLSGGQQQRVGIVRAVAMNPKVLLLDEPTSALDPELVGEVLRVIRDLAAQNWTMVVVTHEISFARQVSDQVLFVDGGVIVERGAPEQVIGAPEHERTAAFLRRLTDPI